MALVTHPTHSRDYTSSPPTHPLTHVGEYEGLSAHFSAGFNQATVHFICCVPKQCPRNPGHQRGLLVSTKMLSAKIAAMFAVLIDVTHSFCWETFFLSPEMKLVLWKHIVFVLLFMNWNICNSLSCSDSTSSLG